MINYSPNEPYNGLTLTVTSPEEDRGFYKVKTKRRFETLYHALKTLHEDTGLNIESAYSGKSLQALCDKANEVSRSGSTWECRDAWK